MILSPNRSHFGGSCATARTSALATLRGQIERIETAEVVHQRDRVALGHGAADGALKGGLARAGRSTRCFAKDVRARPRRALSRDLRGA
ncbi:hypothetical protein ACVWWR_005970 [Bradyrhizobium sp. LM3.2]